MSKEEMKSTVEYKHLQRSFWALVIFTVVWMVLIAAIFAPLSAGEATEASLKSFGTFLVCFAVLLLIIVGPFAVYYGVRLAKIIKNREKYELCKATISTSEQSLWRDDRRLICTAVLENSDKEVEFNVYMRAYENGIELKPGTIVTLWCYKAKNGAIFVSKE